MRKFCKLPFNGLEMSPDGTCQVCCKISRPIKKDDGTNFNLVNDKLEDIWNSNDLKDIRQQFLNGEKPEECSMCWTEEETGNYSLRQQTEHLPYNSNDPKPVYLSLKLSNKCNLACRICGPHLSSLWEQEFKKTNSPTGNSEYYRYVKDAKLTGANLELVHQWASHLEHLLIYGGEPLINEEVLSLLDFLADSGLSKKIHLVLNTNATICSDRIIQKLSQFKKVNLFLSIDDFGPRFEYQRWPARWEKVSANLERFCSLGSPFETRIYPTFSILNLYYMKEILENLSQFMVPINLLNIIHEPGALAIRNAPELMKERFRRKITEVDFSRYQLDGDHDYKSIFLNTINLPVVARFKDTHSWHQSFEWQIGNSDKYREQDFRATFPELSNILRADQWSNQ